MKRTWEIIIYLQTFDSETIQTQTNSPNVNMQLHLCGAAAALSLVLQTFSSPFRFSQFSERSLVWVTNTKDNS